MKKNIYHYKTPFGVLVIKPMRNKPSSFGLYINEEFLGSYSSPISAADDVRSQHTGYYDWDDADIGADYPTDLGDWEIGLP